VALHDWWIKKITQSQTFLAALDDPALKQQLQNPIVGNYINLPIPAYAGLTSRFSNVQENALLPVIQRQIFTDLQTFVQAKEGLTYVHGPQGFAVCRTTPKVELLNTTSYMLLPREAISPSHVIPWVKTHWTPNWTSTQPLNGLTLATLSTSSIFPFCRHSNTKLSHLYLLMYLSISMRLIELMIALQRSPRLQRLVAADFSLLACSIYINIVISRLVWLVSLRIGEGRSKRWLGG